MHLRLLNTPEPAVEPAVEPQVEQQPAAEEEPKALPEKSPEPASKPIDEPVTASIEKPALNGNSPVAEPSVANGPSPVNDASDAPARASPPRISPPKDSPPKVTDGVNTQSAAPSAEPSTEEITESREPESQRPASPVVDKAPEKSPDVGSDPENDVRMVASPPAPAKEATPPDSARDKTPEVGPSEPAKEAPQDTEMSDTPAVEKAEEPEEAVKPSAIEEPAPTSQDTAALPTSEVDLGPASMSQLAIETSEKDSSIVEGSGDVSMSDVPATKVAREREDDVADEPAPKRAKTEPKEDEPVPSGDAPSNDAVSADAHPADATAEVIVSGGDTPTLDESALTKLSQWAGAETDSRSISPYQRREMRKVIGRVKKTKAGSSFRESVQKLWPVIWDSYVAKVDQPMDLAELERRLRDASGPHNTLGDFRKDLALIFENALYFNGASHDVTGSAATAVKAVWEEVLPIPAEEPVKPKAAPKPKPVRESRAAANADTASRRQSAAPAAGPAADSSASANKAGAADQAVDRRSSTATEGDRPKRTVRAPKPKDIDYTTKPSRKKLKPELQFADSVLAELMSPKHHAINAWFLDPVDAEGLNIPNYYSIIKKPMDLGKVSEQLANGVLSSLKDFEKAVRLVFDNCYKFNGPPDQGNPVTALAKQLEDLFVAQMKGKDTWLAKYAKSNAPASASNASDDDDDEDDEDGDDAAHAAVDNKELEELRAKLDEETKKLNGMLLGGNQSLIDIQKHIVDMVQNALIKAAQAAAQARTKSDKPKKAGKGGKAKAAGSGGRKSTGGAGQGKKAGGSKKAAAKKSLNAAEKDQIANAINDLDGNFLDRAIDIIKKDTGQNVSNYKPFTLHLWRCMKLT